jgi:ribosomal protein L11 methyltransferase
MPEYDVVVRWRVEPGRVEVAAMQLWDEGATAVEVREDEVVASFPSPAAAETVAAMVGATAERVPDGWRDAWKEHAGPVEIGQRLVVAPAWRPVPVGSSRLVIEIDPGSCFGSGTHPSTRLALGLLAAEPLGPSVLDVGTGSGILAVAAARLGARSVTAVDVDPDAVTAARRNAERNGVAEVVHASLTPPTELGGGDFDGALVNVTAGVHASVGADVVAAVRAGGRLYLAGLLPGQWQHLAAAYAGCDALDLPVLDGWCGAVLRRRGPPG